MSISQTRDRTAARSAGAHAVLDTRTGPAEASEVEPGTTSPLAAWSARIFCANLARGT